MYEYVCEHSWHMYTYIYTIYAHTDTLGCLQLYVQREREEEEHIKKTNLIYLYYFFMLGYGVAIREPHIACPFLSWKESFWFEVLFHRWPEFRPFRPDFLNSFCVDFRQNPEGACEPYRTDVKARVLILSDENTGRCDANIEEEEEEEEGEGENQG